MPSKCNTAENVTTALSWSSISRILGLLARSKARATARHLAGYRGPLLVIHGDADTLIPFPGGRKVFESAPSGSKTFLSLKGADHNEMYARRLDYWPAIDRFVDGSKNQPSMDH